MSTINKRPEFTTNYMSESWDSHYVMPINYASQGAVNMATSVSQQAIGSANSMSINDKLLSLTGENNKLKAEIKELKALIDELGYKPEYF